MPATFLATGTFNNADGTMVTLGTVTFTPVARSTPSSTVVDVKPVVVAISAGAISQSLVVTGGSYLVTEQVAGAQVAQYSIPATGSNIDLSTVTVPNVPGFNPANWQGIWSSTVTYQVGQMVSRNGSSYVALLPSINQDPASSPTYWATVAVGNPVVGGGSAAADALVVHLGGAGIELVTGDKQFNGRLFVKASNRPRMLDSFAGVDSTLANECAVAVQTALNDFSSQGGGIMELHPLGRYKIASTLLPPANVHVKGCWGGYAGMSPSQLNGSIFQWAGAPNTPMVKFQNVQNAIWDGFGLDGGLTSGAVGVVVDSTNTPRSSDILLNHYWIARMGNPAAGTPGWGIQIAPSGTGTNYQNDRIKIGGGWFEAIDTAIQISSANACDCTTIGGDEPVSIDNYNKGIVIDSCGQMTIDSVTWGAMAQTPQRSVASCVANAGSKVVTVPDGSLVDADVGAAFTHPNVPALYFIAKVLSPTTAELNRVTGITTGTGTGKITRGGTAILLNHFWNSLTIRNCQSESAAYGGVGTSPGLGLRILPTAGGGQSPITMQGNTWGVAHILSEQVQVASIGNAYAFDVVADHDFVNVGSFLDQFFVTYGGSPAQFQKSSTATYATFLKLLGVGVEVAQGPLQVVPGAAEGLLQIGTNASLGLTIAQLGQYVGFFGHAGATQAAHPATLADVITILQNLGLCA